MKSRSKAVADYWKEHYQIDGMCSLCGNTGTLDTRDARTSTGHKVGRENFCICPNGQALRKSQPGRVGPLNPWDK